MNPNREGAPFALALEKPVEKSASTSLRIFRHKRDDFVRGLRLSLAGIGQDRLEIEAPAGRLLFANLANLFD